LVATIGANETYTFPGTASSEAVPIKVIAFANGYEDADAITGVCMYGAAGVGCEMYHYVPNVSLNGTILTIASTNEGAWGIMGDCFDIYVDGTKVLQRQSAEPEGKDFDLSAYLTGDAHEIVVETSYCEAGCKLRAYYTGDWPSVTVQYEVVETKVSAFTVKYEAGCMVIEGAENATSFNMTATVGGNNINETFNGHTYNFYQIQGSRPATNFTPTVTYTFIGMADGLENSDPVTLTITFDEVKADLAAHPEAYQ
jgi:hypothetical protein